MAQIWERFFALAHTFILRSEDRITIALALILAIALFVAIAMTLVALPILLAIAIALAACALALFLAIALFVGVPITLAALAIALFVARHPCRRRHRPLRRRCRRLPATLFVIAIALSPNGLFVARHPRRHRRRKADCCIIVIVASQIDVVVNIAFPPSQTCRPL